MRRALVGRITTKAAQFTARGLAIAECFYFAPEPGQFVGEFEHGLILLGHVPLKVGDFLLKTCDVFAQR